MKNENEKILWKKERKKERKKEKSFDLEKKMKNGKDEYFEEERMKERILKGYYIRKRKKVQERLYEGEINK